MSQSLVNARFVYLHGFLGDAETFTDVCTALPASAIHLPLTLYGHAGAEESQELESFEQEVDRLACLIRRHFQAQPAHLVGYSLGGRLALGLLVRAPALFRSATLVSTRRGLDSVQERQERLQSDMKWAGLLRRHGLEAFLDTWDKQPLFASLRMLPSDRIAALRERRLRHSAEGLAQALAGLSLGRMPSYAREIEGIEVPVTLVAGALDPKFCDLASDLARLFHRGLLVVVKDAGHNLVIERPEDVAQAITEGYRHE
jgi:2-succinyl-6-hydroxy-2,4-cyclohexadiene-1-carboxylate synthase